MTRGDIYHTPGGGRGRYVGTTPHGVEWVAYGTGAEDDFAALCLAFDCAAVLRHDVRAALRSQAH